MANRRDALKLAAGVALGSQFGNALASGGQETTPAADLSGIFIAGATGEQRVSPVDTEARGAAFFAVNEDGDGIDYTLAVQDLEDVTMAHIHASEVGEAGGVVAWLYPEDAEEPDPIPGEFDGVLATGTITEDDLTGPLEGESLETLLGEMRGGGIYVNVHTEANPDGEVRGQVVTVTEVVDCLGLEQQATTTPEGEETAPPEDGETTPPEDEETPPPEEETTTPDEDGETAEETTTT
jgi:hypothetical protein